MTRILRTSVLLTTTLSLGLMGCAEDTNAAETEAIGRGGGGGARIDICKYTSSAANPLNEISVNASAWPAHEAAGAVLQGDWWADEDGDGYGDGSASAATCPPDATAATTWVENGADCDDADAAVNPDAEEVCDDGLDNNCDGLTDDEDEAVCGCPLWDQDSLDDFYSQYDNLWGGHGNGGDDFELQGWTGMGWVWVPDANDYHWINETAGNTCYGSSNQCGDWENWFYWSYYSSHAWYGTWDNGYYHPAHWDYTTLSDAQFGACTDELEQYACDSGSDYYTWDGTSHCD